MLKPRLSTPWKKSRTYGDVYGGRKRRRMTDNIFARAHSLQKPAPNQQLPILIQDNPSKNFMFPVTVEEFAQALYGLPESHRSDITHIWLRRHPNHNRQGNSHLAEFICGSGVRVIIIYPWRIDGRLFMGRNKPSGTVISQYLRFGATVLFEDGSWYIHLSISELRKFYIEHIFCHEVGHHVDWYHRQWSKANARKVEQYADQYAVLWGADASAWQITPDKSEGV